MDKDHIKILLVEDDEDDYTLVRKLLSEIRLADFSLEWVKTYQESLKELCRGDHDAYLLDYRLGARNGLELIREATGTGCDKPIIFRTGQGDHGVDMEAIRSGAADYLDKAQLTTDMLERSVRYSIARKKSERELKSYRNHLEDLVKERTEQLETANEKLRVEITERKRAEATLLESEQRVRRLNEHILNMVMVMSHDIRGPLVAIASILKLMLRGVYGKLDQGHANTVKELLSRCARLLGTAEDYLGKASIVEGSLQMEREVLDLR
jgi:FixJ family two-component response regulator